MSRESVDRFSGVMGQDLESQRTVIAAILWRMLAGFPAMGGVKRGKRGKKGKVEGKRDTFGLAIFAQEGRIADYVVDACFHVRYSLISLHYQGTYDGRKTYVVICTDP